MYELQYLTCFCTFLLDFCLEYLLFSLITFLPFYVSFYDPLQYSYVKSLWSHWDCVYNVSLIRKKGEFQNGGNKKAKHAKFSEKQTFSTAWYANARVRVGGVRNVPFSENLACFAVLLPPFWNSPFRLLAYYRRIVKHQLILECLQWKLTSNIKA